MIDGVERIDITIGLVRHTRKGLHTGLQGTRRIIIEEVDPHRGETIIGRTAGGTVIGTGIGWTLIGTQGTIGGGWTTIITGGCGLAGNGDY